MTFQFSAQNLAKAKKYIQKYPEGRERSAIKALLDLAQRQNNGWLSKESIEYVAQFLNMPFVKAMEIATFYTMFNLKPVGKNHIKICGTTPCWLNGAEVIKKTCQNHLDINIGDITDDQMFSIEEVECLGACVNAPVIQINDDYYEDLDATSLCHILDQLADNKKVTPGSAQQRQCSKAKKHAE